MQGVNADEPIPGLGGGSAAPGDGCGSVGARGQAPWSCWHCAGGRRRGSRAPALFGREKARTGALCVSRSHARLETRPRAQTINAGVRKRGKRGVGMAGNGQGEEQGSSHRQTDRQSCRTMSLQAAEVSAAPSLLLHWQRGRSNPWLSPLPSTAQCGSCCCCCWDPCRERGHSPAASGCSHCWEHSRLHPHGSHKP